VRPSFLGVALPGIGEDEIEELLATVRSGWVTSGPRVQRFQHALEAYMGVDNVRCLTSCTAGLTLALHIAGVGQGDEVLLPSVTFVSCANAIVHSGATPVFVDCDPLTGLLDLDHAESLVGPRTRALMPVHLGGRPVDMDRVAQLRDRHDLVVIEDAAHAIGAEWRGRRIGAAGNLTSYSFHATKNMTTFEGGALVTRDADEADRVGHLALHGVSRSAWDRHGAVKQDRYDVLEPGFKYGMHDVAAAVGIHQLARLDGWIARRDELARGYDELLADLPLEREPPPPDHTRHARHLYMVRVRPDALLDRDDIVEGLRERNIGSTVHFQAIHLFTYYRERFGLAAEALPASLDWSRRSITLPLHPAMTAEDQLDVASALSQLLG
jgi:dTDP-4-amino-4,6-dideoxygalactose transaminase